MNKFLGTPNPDKCVIYGPRLCVKFSPAQRFGTPDETKLYRRLCELCCWSGEDKTHFAAVESDLTVILSFEFPFLGIQIDDDEETRDARLNYHRAVDELRAAGYDDDVDGEEFFDGFEK